jgi:hypothetical protein
MVRITIHRNTCDVQPTLVGDGKADFDYLYCCGPFKKQTEAVSPNLIPFSLRMP